MDQLAFVKAALRGDFPRVEEALRRGLPPDEPCFLYAIENLLLAGYDGPAWASPFLAAVVRPHSNLKVIRRLLEAGADVDTKEPGYGGRSALHWAARLNLTDHAMCLLDHGASPWNSEGILDDVSSLTLYRRLMEMSPPLQVLQWALTCQGRDIPQRYLAAVEAGADVNLPFEDGATPLHCVSHPKSIRTLVRLGADLEAKIDEDTEMGGGWTPLGIQVGAMNARLEATATLVRLGANVNFIHRSGKSILLHAVSNGERHPARIRPLLKGGADPTYVYPAKEEGELHRYLGANALHFAIEGSSLSPADLEDSQGPETWESEWVGETGEIFRMLVEAGVPIEGRTAEGLTPLMMATSSGDFLSASYLLEMGANPNVRMPNLRDRSDDADKTPLMDSIECPWLIKRLLAAGADPHARCRQGSTALDHARELLAYLEAPGPWVALPYASDHSRNAWADLLQTFQGGRYKEALADHEMRRRNLQRVIALLEADAR
jgi:ankyrin repeat protein